MQVLDDSEVKKGTQVFEPRAETLWDIEIEKENTENHKNEIRRRRRRDDSINNKNILPAISSTGVLLQSLFNKSSNSIDFVFVLNVRESEAYPPLLTQPDIQCAEDKMALLGGGVGNVYQNDGIDWKGNFLKECINNRISYDQQQQQGSDSFQQKPAYETQITIVRLSISCTCNDLNPKKEICSSFASKQKWMEYMGNQLDGTFNV